MTDPPAGARWGPSVRLGLAASPRSPPPGGALAAFTVVLAVGQMAGPYLAGALADRYGTGATLARTAALCGAGAVVSAAIRPAHRRPPPANSSIRRKFAHRFAGEPGIVGPFR